MPIFNQLRKILELIGRVLNDPEMNGIVFRRRLPVVPTATHDVRSVEKHFQEKTAEPQISSLRGASVEMTKGRAVPLGRVVAEQKPFFIALGGPKGP